MAAWKQRNMRQRNSTPHKRYYTKAKRKTQMQNAGAECKCNMQIADAKSYLAPPLSPLRELLKSEPLAQALGTSSLGTLFPTLLSTPKHTPKPHSEPQYFTNSGS
jgi:hypothetical protein